MVSTRNTSSKRDADEGATGVEGDNKRVKVDADEGGLEKGQRTIEEVMGVGDRDGVKDEGREEKNSHAEAKENGQTEKENGSKNGHSNGKHTSQKADKKENKGENGTKNGHPNGANTSPDQKASKEEKNAFDEVKSDPKDVKKAASKEETEKTSAITKNEDSIIEDPKREEAMPSSILEKGIIYFFYRGRVNIDDPHSVDDLARSYMVLRPLPIGAKIGDGPLQDTGNARLLALPKKVLPRSKRDKFLVFVEMAGVSVKELKDEFLRGGEYGTKTAGTSHTPPVTPLAEGIYAITTTGRESHLAYQITIPTPFPTDSKSPQQELGLNEKGSYVVSAKNPTAKGNVGLENPAEYPEEVMKKFRGLRWMPLIPELLEYKNTQFLIIGEGMGDMDKAMEEQEGDKNEKRESPGEEMDKLEQEDHARIEHLKGPNKEALFTDLGLSSKEYPKMETTW